MSKLSDKPIYSIVIPAYKEEAVIGSSLKTISSFLDENSLKDLAEIILVIAESNDATKEIANELATKFRRFTIIEPGPKVGKGRDVKAGMLASQGKYIVFTDADLATPVYHIKDAFNHLEAGADVVIGKRNLKSIHTGYRSLLSRCSNLLTRSMVLPKIADTQCGFKGFNRNAVNKIFPKCSISGWSFDIEVLVLARQNKLEIEELDINDWSDPKLNAGFVGENPLIAISHSLKELLIIKYRLLRKRYSN
ncbi:MAG: glycosyltransferase [Acidimicrobiia bacterium]